MNKTILLNFFLLTNLLSFGQEKQFSLQDFYTNNSSYAFSSVNASERVVQMIVTFATELNNPKLHKS